MPIFTVQCGVGPVGGKAVTTLSYAPGPFLGLVETSGYAYGFNEGGVWQLNHGDKDDESDIVYRLILNTSDFGVRGHLKKLNYIYASLKGKYDGMEVLTKPDTGGCLHDSHVPPVGDQGFYHWSRCTPHQRGFRAAVGSRLQGEFWAIGLETKQPFTLLGLSVSFIKRPAGISNGGA